MKQITTTKGHILAVNKKSESYEDDALKAVRKGFVSLGLWSLLRNVDCMTMLGITLESFASLMHANGKFLVNPMGKDPRLFYHGEQNEGLEVCYEWQKYQQATGEYLILFKPNK